MIPAGYIIKWLRVYVGGVGGVTPHIPWSIYSATYGNGEFILVRVN